MEAVGSAVGIASLGIQACQGLLSYYDDWRDYKPEVTSTYEAIDDLSRSLAQVLPFLQNLQLEAEKRDIVGKSVRSCEDGLGKLSRKLQKLRTYPIPEGARQRAWAEIQRGWYPLRPGTLLKVLEHVEDTRASVQPALEILQLDPNAQIRERSTGKEDEMNTPVWWKLQLHQSSLC